MNEKVIDPKEVVAIGDPGDETQRNFRYQHGYGAILLIASATGRVPYKAVWCEHHEDLLCERNNETYDAYQIKTSQPELGAWQNNDEDIRKSIKRFVALQKIFATKINGFVIVSNTNFFNCAKDVKPERLKQSPIRLLEAVGVANAPDKLNSPFFEVLNELSKECGCTDAELLTVLKKTSVAVGPSRDDFDAVISHDHLTQLEACRELPKIRLNAIRDEIVQQIYLASSLRNEDPSRHLSEVLVNGYSLIKAKRVSIEKIISIVESSEDLLFRYQPIEISLRLGAKQEASNPTILEKKFAKGALEDQIQTMKRRMMSAERRLLELNAKHQDKFQNILAQLESVVQGECDEASLESKPTDAKETKPYGPLMLKNLYARLRKIIEDRPHMVYNEPYETLVGVAGLLTDNCSVWWSEKFDIQDAA